MDENIKNLLIEVFKRGFFEAQSGKSEKSALEDFSKLCDILKLQYRASLECENEKI